MEKPVSKPGIWGRITKKELLRLIRETTNASVKVNLITELQNLVRKEKRNPKNGDKGGGIIR